MGILANEMPVVLPVRVRSGVPSTSTPSRVTADACPPPSKRERAMCVSSVAFLLLLALGNVVWFLATEEF